MTKWMVFLFFWVTMTISIHQGDVLAFILLLPAFLILWAWAEELDDMSFDVRQGDSDDEFK